MLFHDRLMQRRGRTSGVGPPFWWTSLRPALRGILFAWRAQREEGKKGEMPTLREH